MEKVVLAYSGDLESTVMLKWLSLKGMEVIAFIANVGQLEDFQSIQERALNAGASKVVLEDLQEDFVSNYIFPSLQANALYEGGYQLGAALSRPLIAKAQIACAKSEQATLLAHGATGRGNDQIRFELTYHALEPSMEVVPLWRDSDFFASFHLRSKMLAFAEEHGLLLEEKQKKPYREDHNIAHVCHEDGILENPEKTCDEDVYTITRRPEDAPDEATILEIDFSQGTPTRVNNLTSGTEVSDPLDILNYLNNIGSLNGIGRLDMVENRFIGLKTRGIYETPGMSILMRAHRDLEGLTMDREVMSLRDSLIPRFAQAVYNGFWFSPEMEFMQVAIRQSQQYISGKVQVRLYKGGVYPISRSSAWSLYPGAQSSHSFENMEHHAFSHQDASGFIRLQALRLKNFYGRLN